MTFHRSDQLWCDSQLYIYISTLRGCDIRLDLTVIFHWWRHFTVLVVIFHTVMLTVIFESVTFHSLHNWYNHHGRLGVQNQLLVHVPLWLWHLVWTKFYLYSVILNSINKYRKHKSNMLIWVDIWLWHFTLPDCNVPFWSWCSTLTVLFHSDHDVPLSLWHYDVSDSELPLCDTSLWLWCFTVYHVPPCNVPLWLWPSTLTVTFHSVLTVMFHSDGNVPRCVADIK